MVQHSPQPQQQPQPQNKATSFVIDSMPSLLTPPSYHSDVDTIRSVSSDDSINSMNDNPTPVPRKRANDDSDIRKHADDEKSISESLYSLRVDDFCFTATPNTTGATEGTSVMPDKVKRIKTPTLYHSIMKCQSGAQNELQDEDKLVTLLHYIRHFIYQDEYFKQQTQITVDSLRVKLQNPKNSIHTTPQQVKSTIIQNNATINQRIHTSITNSMRTAITHVDAGNSIKKADDYDDFIDSALTCHANFLTKSTTQNIIFIIPEGAISKHFQGVMPVKLPDTVDLGLIKHVKNVAKGMGVINGLGKFAIKVMTINADNIQSLKLYASIHTRYIVISDLTSFSSTCRSLDDVAERVQWSDCGSMFVNMILNNKAEDTEERIVFLKNVAASARFLQL